MVAAKVGASARRAVEAFEAEQRPRPKKRAHEPARLRESEIADLDALWSPRLYTVDGGTGALCSNMGAIRDRLLRMSEPKEGQARHALLSELARHGGRLPEGKLLRIVVFENSCTSRREASAALQMLRNLGKIDRIRTTLPHAEVETLELTEAQRRAQGDWTGFDVRFIPAAEREERRKRAAETAKIGRKGKRSRAALDAAKALLEHLEIGEETDIAETAAVDDAVIEHVRRRTGDASADGRPAWRRHQDEELQRVWQTMDVHDDSGGGTFDEAQVLGGSRLFEAQRAMAAIAMMAPALKNVLRWVYGGGMGGRPSEEQINEACREFRAARAVVLRAARKARRK